MDLNKIDINYDFRLDSSCGDPDVDSKKLYEILSLLFSKKLPNNKKINLGVLKTNNRLLLKNNLIDNFSSDRMCPPFIGKFKNRFDCWLSESEKNQFQYIVRTLVGHIFYPAHVRGGPTINQARGFNGQVRDRFDLTLECIKRFYSTQRSPLFEDLLRYKDFFKLFNDFDGYVNYFFLQDFIKENMEVKFLLPFDNFIRTSLPINQEEFKNYMLQTITAITKRNKRLLKYISDNQKI